MVCEWYLLGKSDELNMLWALLAIYQDSLTLKFMGYYEQYLTKGLFIYALEHNNTPFLQEALNAQAFERSYFREPMIVTKLLKIFQEDCAKTNLVLNVFLLTDISLWRPNFLEDLLDVFDKYLEGYQLLLSNNPLMSIALTCDLVVKIGVSRKMFKDRCNETLETLLTLGMQYSAKIEDEEYYDQLIS